MFLKTLVKSQLSIGKIFFNVGECFEKYKSFKNHKPTALNCRNDGTKIIYKKYRLVKLFNTEVDIINRLMMTQITGTPVSINKQKSN